MGLFPGAGTMELAVSRTSCVSKFALSECVAIAIRLEAIAIRVEAISLRLRCLRECVMDSPGSTIFPRAGTSQPGRRHVQLEEAP